MKCERCGHESQYMGTAAWAEWFMCPNCDAVAFVPVPADHVRCDPTVEPKPDGHLGAVER